MFQFCFVLRHGVTTSFSARCLKVFSDKELSIYEARAAEHTEPEQLHKSQYDTCLYRNFIYKQSHDAAIQQAPRHVDMARYSLVMAFACLRPWLGPPHTIEI